MLVKRIILAMLMLMLRECSTIEDCPFGCICNNHHSSVVCSNGEFFQLPFVPISTKNLNINNNKNFQSLKINLNLKASQHETKSSTMAHTDEINTNKNSDVNDKSYGSTNTTWVLVELSLKRNRMSSQVLSTNDFHLFPYLKVLRLDYNNISFLPKNLFRNNHHLEKLSISNNPLPITNPNSLAALDSMNILSSLRFLDLSATLIIANKSLPMFFSTFTSLSTLLLQSTRLFFLNSNFTNPLNAISSLKRLDFSRSLILQASISAFVNLSQVAEIDFSESTMSLNVFETIIQSLNHSNVEVLNLDHIFNGENNYQKNFNNYSSSNSTNNTPNNYSHGSFHISHNIFHKYNASRLIVLNMDGNTVAFRGSRIPERIFQPLKHLTDLYLDHCNLFSIPHKTFQNLNRLRKVSLKGNFLSCNQGSICDFLKGPTLKHLKYLDLSNNLISQVRFMHKTFPSLEFLDLKQNNFINIEVPMFKSLRNLLQLDLSYNLLLEDIANNAFVHLTFLTSLNLEGCKHLGRLRQGVFHGLSSLRVLNLRESGLVHIHHAAFHHLYQLEELYLRKNRFGEMKNSISNLTMMKSSIKTLDLGENNLKSLPLKLLSNSFELHTLYFDNNRLADCQQLNVLSSVLETLDLSNNFLVSPHSSCFQILKNLRWLDLSDNPFYCDCQLHHFASWLSRFSTHNNHLCAAPAPLLNINIFSFNPSNFDCPEFREAFLIVCLSLCVATLAFLAGAFCSLYLNNKTTKQQAFLNKACNNNNKYTPLYNNHASFESLDDNSDPPNLLLSSKLKLNRSKNSKSRSFFNRHPKKQLGLIENEKMMSSERKEGDLKVIDGSCLALTLPSIEPPFEGQIHVEDSVL